MNQSRSDINNNCFTSQIVRFILKFFALIETGFGPEMTFKDCVKVVDVGHVVACNKVLKESSIQFVINKIYCSFYAYLDKNKYNLIIHLLVTQLSLD